MQKPDAPTKLGRYQIVRELGKGAMGVVYEGIDPNIGRRVAIKTARRDVLQSSDRADELMERFLREAKAAGALNHPNIITIYDADEEDNITYIAMEFLEGGDLQELIDKKIKLDVAKIVEIGATVCEALAVAHQAGIVHRDIKPANILMPTGKPLKLADFGIARTEDSNLTQEGSMIGTPYYMSPEQFMGQRADGRADLFAVGVIMYEMLSGEKPFGGDTLSSVMHKVMKVEPVEPKELNCLVPDALNDVLMKALNKKPMHRYQDGNAMAAALRESIKPNPNPAILGLSSTSAATIVGAGNATVVTNAAATILSPVAGEGAAPSPAPVKTREVKKPFPLKAIAIGVLIVIVGVASALITMKRPSATPQQNTQITPSSQLSGEVTLNLMVYQADTKEQWTTYDANNQTTPEDKPDTKELAFATGELTAKVTDPVTKKVLVEKKLKGEDSPYLLKIPGASSRVLVELSKEGYNSVNKEFMSLKSGETKTVFMVLVKEGI